MYEYLDRRYALALYELAEESGKTEEYLNELREIVDLIKNNAELSGVIRHPEITTSQKKKIFKSIFEGKINENILSYLLLLIDKDRIIYLEEKLNEMEKIHLEKQNILVANVKTVVPLSDKEKTALIDKFKKKYDKNILLKEEIDKSLIGGVYIRVGNDVIDDTIKSTLEKIRKKVIARQDKAMVFGNELNNKINKRKNKSTALVANVKTVVPLTYEERTSLINNLKNKYGRDVVLKEELDESLIGGIYLRIGTDIMDYTIKSKLEETKYHYNKN